MSSIAADYSAPPPAKAQPRGLVLVAIVIVLAIANFLSILDLTIVNVLVPHISGALAVSSSDGTWVITAYAVAEAITVPLTGWLAERFGPVRVFLVCIAAFGVFSALCGMATSLGMLILFRVLLGMAGGPVIPLSQTLLLQIVPQRHATIALAAWSMTTIVAPIAGPALGGLIGDNWGWAWAFYVNVPLAIVFASLGWWVLTPHETPVKKAPADFVGLGLLILWVASLQIMLGNGQDLDWFNSRFIDALLVTSVVGFLAFVIWELTEQRPIVNVRIFANRSFSVSMLVIALTFGAMFGSIVLVPLWLQTAMGYTATLAGYNSAFMGVFSIMAAPLVAFLMTRVDHRALVTVGLFLGAASTLSRVFFTQDMTFEQLLLPQIGQGFAMPFIMIPLMDMSVSSLRPEDTASGAGQFNFIRTLSSAVSTALVIAAWVGAIDMNKAALAGQLHHPQAVLARLQAGGFPHDKALHMLDQMVQQQAVMLGTNQTFMAVGIVMLVAACVVWLAPKPPRHGGGKTMMH